MATEAAAPHEYGLGKTARGDSWWAGPLATALGLGGFVVYSTFRAIYNAEYEFGHGAINPVDPSHAYLLSPFYSPLLVLPWRTSPRWRPRSTNCSAALPSRVVAECGRKEV